MVQHDPSSYGRRIAEVYDETVRDLPTTAAVTRIAHLARGGPVLEFGIGTGRLALPLLDRGIAVAGIDGSPDMVRRLRDKEGGASIPVQIGDFADTRVAGRFSLVLLAYNTVFAVPSQQAQLSCFRNAAAHLQPAGCFVVEAEVPDVGAFRNGTAIRVKTLTQDEVTVEVARLDPVEQRMTTTRVRFTGEGVRLLPANHRYVWPSELDLMAELAGMRLESRHADWSGSPYGEGSGTHVSVYRLPDEGS